MSYTMTIDAPEKVTSYVERRGPRFKALLGSMFIAFVTYEMQQEEGAENSSERYNGGAVFKALQACPNDFDLGQTIPKRVVGYGRAHPIDFTQLFIESV